MKIIIEQALHGYLNGHQLLNSSLDLPIEERKILLYQSDLSGSNVEESFKTYITGYPLTSKNLYAFAKTWYANEMKRPGCVWTHTLLINFSDLGKIPELNLLLSLFKRPHINEYQTYSNQVILTEEELVSSFIENKNQLDKPKEVCLSALYEYPQTPVVIPSDSPENFENAILSVWSDQWPRLRRNFTFCSGAISLKSIKNKLFDLQVVPNSRVNSIERQVESILIARTSDMKINFDWQILKNHLKTDLRRFLWTYGSDINGERSNYIPLLKIFDLINRPNISIRSISNSVSDYFPYRDQAMYLKSKLYGNGSILTPSLSEKEIIEYLITSEDISFVSSEISDLDERLVNLIKSNQISKNEFFQYWKNAKHQRISNNIWKNIDISYKEAIALMNGSVELCQTFIEILPEIIYQPELWKTNINFQKQVIGIIQNNNSINWRDLTVAVLEAESQIIFEVFRILGKDAILISLDWLNSFENPKSLINDWSKFVVIEQRLIFRDWLMFKYKNINAKIYALIFIYFDINQVRELNFDSDFWIIGYKKLLDKNYHANMVYVASLLLSIGFNNRIRNSDALVAETFHDVYSYAASSKIDQPLWNLIPTDIETFNNNENHTIINSIFSIIGIRIPSKKYQVESWDYCEILTRTLANKYIKYNWPTQSFLDSLKNKSAFERTISYCLSFEKGIKLMLKISRDVMNNNTHPLTFQKEIISRLYNSFKDQPKKR